MGETDSRSGMVAIIGLPNTGKSSLLNRFLGSKLSIVTAAAQTTRERVVGIDTGETVQIIFLDTPGLVEPAYLLHHSMLHIVEQALADADVVVLLLDGTRAPPELDAEIGGALRRRGSQLIVAINKIDVAGSERIDMLRDWVGDHFGQAPLEISAETGEGIAGLRARITERLPFSPFLYPEEDISIQSVRFFVAELIRETIFEQYQEEVPYSVAVRVEEFRESSDPIYIRANVYVERPTQKGILIGHRGEGIRKLGAAARGKIESFVGARVYLDLWIKVLPRWRKDPLELKRFGFPVPPDLQE
jgi:GTPase